MLSQPTVGQSVDYLCPDLLAAAKLRSSMCFQIASVTGGIIFVHVRVFSSPFSTRLNSSSVETFLVLLNNNTAGYAG